MKQVKTTSIIQVYDLENYRSSSAALVVRPPSFMRCFRVQIFISSQFDNVLSNLTKAAYVATVENANVNGAILLSNSSASIITNNLPPDPNNSTGAIGVKEIVLDRRGVGYMADTFYIWEASEDPPTGICFIWEGEID